MQSMRAAFCFPVASCGIKHGRLTPDGFRFPPAAQLLRLIPCRSPSVLFRSGHQHTCTYTYTETQRHARTCIHRHTCTDPYIKRHRGRETHIYSDTYVETHMHTQRFTRTHHTGTYTQYFNSKDSSFMCYVFLCFLCFLTNCFPCFEDSINARVDTGISYPFPV